MYSAQGSYRHINSIIIIIKPCHCKHSAGFNLCADHQVFAYCQHCNVALCYYMIMTGNFLYKTCIASYGRCDGHMITTTYMHTHRFVLSYYTLLFIPTKVLQTLSVMFCSIITNYSVRRSTSVRLYTIFYSTNIVA